LATGECHDVEVIGQLIGLHDPYIGALLAVLYVRLQLTINGCKLWMFYVTAPHQTKRCTCYLPSVILAFALLSAVL